MYQLSGAWTGTDCGECKKEYEGAQALWYKFSFDCYDSQHSVFHGNPGRGGMASVCQQGDSYSDYCRFSHIYYTDYCY